MKEISFGSLLLIHYYNNTFTKIHEYQRHEKEYDKNQKGNTEYIYNIYIYIRLCQKNVDTNKPRVRFFSEICFLFLFACFIFVQDNFLHTQQAIIYLYFFYKDCGLAAIKSEAFPYTYFNKTLVSEMSTKGEDVIIFCS